MFNRGSKGSAVAAVITDNEYKLVLNAIFEARDRHGRTTNITYLMTWFRTNKTVAVDV